MDFFGRLIKDERIGARMTEETLAKELGITVDDLILYESGDKSATLPILMRASVVFGRPIGYFLQGVVYKK